MPTARLLQVGVCEAKVPLKLSVNTRLGNIKSKRVNDLAWQAHFGERIFDLLTHFTPVF